MDALVELLLYALLGMARLAWLAMKGPPPDWTRWRDTHAFLARRATRVVDEDDVLTATFGPAHGRARIVIDRRRGRVRAECPWDGGGLRIPKRALRGAPLPPVLAPLRELPIDDVSSDPSTLVVSGPRALAFELPSLLGALWLVAQTGRRARPYR